MKQPFRIRPKADPVKCSAIGCRHRAEIVDATHRFWDRPVPLCSIHWARRDVDRFKPAG